MSSVTTWRSTATSWGVALMLAVLLAAVSWVCTLVSYHAWLIMTIAGALLAIAWLAVAQSRPRPRRTWAAVAFAALVCLCFMTPLRLTLVPANVPTNARIVRTSGMHPMLVDGWLPLWFRVEGFDLSPILGGGDVSSDAAAKGPMLGILFVPGSTFLRLVPTRHELIDGVSVTTRDGHYWFQGDSELRVTLGHPAMLIYWALVAFLAWRAIGLLKALRRDETT